MIIFLLTLYAIGVGVLIKALIGLNNDMNNLIDEMGSLEDSMHKLALKSGRTIRYIDVKDLK